MYRQPTPCTIGPVDRALVARVVEALKPYEAAACTLAYHDLPEAIIVTAASRFRWASVRGVDSVGVTVHTIATDEFYAWEQVVSVSVAGVEFPIRRAAPVEIAA